MISTTNNHVKTQPVIKTQDLALALADDRGKVDVIVLNVLKAFDCLPGHQLLKTVYLLSKPKYFLSV